MYICVKKPYVTYVNTYLCALTPVQGWKEGFGGGAVRCQTLSKNYIYLSYSTQALTPDIGG